jgi:histidinol-phosphate aminotransferase
MPGVHRSTAIRDPKATIVTGHETTPAPQYLARAAIVTPLGVDDRPTGSADARTLASPGVPGVTPRPDLAGHVPYRSPRPLVPVRLDTNESPYPPCGALRTDLAKLAGAHDWHRYGDLDATALRTRLAALHGRTVEGVWVAAGTFELLAQLLLAFGGPRRSLVVLQPAWGGYRQVAAATGTQLVDDRAGADVVVVCSPSNPSGHPTPIETIARRCAEQPASLVVVDEAYAEFSAAPSAAGLLDQFPNLVVLRTFSKALALADLRLGYLLADPELVRVLPKVRVPWQPSGFAQAAGLLALGYLDDVAATVALVVRERGRLAEALAGLPGVRVRPSEANFLCFATPLPSDEVRRALLGRGVAIRDVSGLPHLPGHLRVTVGAPADNRAFLAALRAVLP